MALVSPEAEPLLHNRVADTEYGNLSRDDESLSFAQTTSKADFDSGSDSDDDEAEIKRKREERLKETGGWVGYLKDFKIFLPYLIPRNNAKVQLSIVVSLLAIGGQRVLNILVPLQLSVIADKLLDRNLPYKEVGIWFLLSALDSYSGLRMIENLATISIKQFSERQITNAAFSHVLSLSMDFHPERDSAEVMKALEQGSSLTKLLKTAVCESLPTVVDVTVTLFILYWKFGVFVSLVMLFACALFLGLEIFTSRWKVEPRRRSAKAERQTARVMHQTIQGWATVSYFNMFHFEQKRFGKAVDAKLAADRRWSILDTGI
ncbi:Nn.00g005950.m01.CDS01 [Neocucurbitaria sp. VM-36]